MNGPPATPQVVVTVPGRLHAFDLAVALHEESALGGLITSYPWFLVDRSRIPRPKVTGFPSHELLARGWRKLPARVRRLYDPYYRFNDLFDRRASLCLPAGDVFIGFSGAALHSLRRAKQAGMRTLVTRGSSHIAYQRRILREEYSLHGAEGDLPDQRTVDRELREYSEADFVRIPSAFVKRSFLQEGFAEDRLLHIPYGVDLRRFSPRPRHDHRFRVIHCGPASLRKGVHYLLQAFAELALPRAELWLVGSIRPELSPFLHRWADNSRVKLLGQRPQHQLPDLYSQADLLCLASIEEGLANVQPQAMACGLPILCTTNTGGEDLIRAGVEGFVVPIRDVESLKDRLLWCYENRDECRAMGQAARTRIADFTWRHHVRELLQACEGWHG